jgi:hypothetical protein
MSQLLNKKRPKRVNRKDPLESAKGIFKIK